MKAAYYNEIDAEKAAWIRELIKAGVVAPGDVDERSISDVRADDLRGYTQCHFFAGIGVWSYALRLAGWPDDRPVWTGSCPCPSFSCAGKGEGFDDARHLWPAWYSLIRQCRPGTVFGEQVAAAIGHGWLDLVCGDMEAEEYAIAAAVLGAHSAGAPHIRQRLYFCAYAANGDGRRGERAAQEGTRPDGEWRRGLASGGDAGECADAADARRYDAREHGSRPSLLAARPEQRGGTGERAYTQHDGHDSAQRPASVTDCHESGVGLFDRDGLAGERADTNSDGTRRDAGREASASCEAARTGGGSREVWPGTSALTGGNGSLFECADTGRDGRRSDLAQREAQGRVADGRDCTTGDLCHPSLGGLAMRGSTPGNGGHAARTSEPLGSNHTFSPRLEGHFGDVREWRGPGWLDPITARSVAAAGATRGFWADCDWWWGRDSKFRPIGRGISPLISGAAKSSVLKMADGSAESLGRVCDEIATAAQEEISESAKRHQIDAREAVLHLWQAYAAATLEQRHIGRCYGLQQAPVLFAFLRQLTQQGWPLTEGVPRESAEDARIMLRGLRRDETAACPSCKRGLDEQRSEQCADALHILSSLLARHALAAWTEGFHSNAADNSNMARVLRLRGYGDAICAETAAHFIACCAGIDDLTQPPRESGIGE